MPKYRLIEHTADIGVTAYGETLEGAFANAAYGMFSIMADLRRVRTKESRTIKLSEKEPEKLLFNWLNSLLYFFDVEGLLLKKFDVKLNDAGLEAMCYGEIYDPTRHRLKLGVKSATYYMLKVDREKNQVQVIFDV